MMRFEHLGRRYGAHWALDDASGVVESGRVTALTGENGSGKSTLLLCLAHILKPHRGSLHMEPNVRIHLVAHHPMAYTDLSIAQNLELCALLENRDKSAILPALDHWRIGELRSKPLKALSRGQMQRFLLARATLAQPDILLLDEPFTGLDARSETLLQAFMREEVKRGAAVLFSEHDAARARALAEKSIRMENGRSVP